MPESFIDLLKKTRDGLSRIKSQLFHNAIQINKQRFEIQRLQNQYIQLLSENNEYRTLYYKLKAICNTGGSADNTNNANNLDIQSDNIQKVRKKLPNNESSDMDIESSDMDIESDIDTTGPSVHENDDRVNNMRPQRKKRVSYVGQDNCNFLCSVSEEYVPGDDMDSNIDPTSSDMDEMLNICKVLQISTGVHAEIGFYGFQSHVAIWQEILRLTQINDVTERDATVGNFSSKKMRDIQSKLRSPGKIGRKTEMSVGICEKLSEINRQNED